MTWVNIRDTAHTLFKSLPAPKPTIRHTSYRGGGSNTPPQLSNMSRYSQVDNGCLHEDSLVLLTNLRTVKCKDVKPGMQVVCYVMKHGLIRQVVDTVECVVRTKCGKSTFIQLPDSEL